MIDGYTTGTVIRNNEIGVQKVGIRIGQKAGTVTLEKNRVAGAAELEDLRKQ